MNPQAWKTLEDRALWCLEHPDQASPRDSIQGMALLLRLWRYRRSGAHVSWGVFLAVPDYRTRPGVIRETVWDRLGDWKARRGPAKALKRRHTEAPAILSRDAELGWDDLRPYVDRLAGLRSPRPPIDPSCVGDAFGLEGFRSLSHVRLQWCGKGDRRWRETIGCIGRLRAALMRALRERERTRPGPAS